LSITDDRFADVLQTVENDLVDAYAHGELSGPELEQFRSYYLASPLRRKKVEFAQGLRAFNDKPTTESVAVSREGGLWHSFSSVFTTPKLAFQWGMALATVALLIAGGWLWFENTRLRQQVSQTQASRDALTERERELQKELETQLASNASNGEELARLREEEARRKELEGAAGQPAPTGSVSIASFVLAPQLRGAGGVPTLTVPAATGSLAMRLELEPNDFSTYRVVLLDTSGKRELWRSNQLTAKATGGGKALNVSFRADLVKPQTTYMLRVTGSSPNDGSEVIGDYQFRVVKNEVSTTSR